MPNIIKKLKENACLQLIRPSNRKLNTIRSSTSESSEHIAKKNEICNRLLKEEKTFITEAIFEEEGLRADIVILSEFKIIEIVKTESMDSLLKKADICEKLGLTMEVVRC